MPTAVIPVGTPALLSELRLGQDVGASTSPGTDHGVLVVPVGGSMYPPRRGRRSEVELDHSRPYAPSGRQMSQPFSQESRRPWAQERTSMSSPHPRWT